MENCFRISFTVNDAIRLLLALSKYAALLCFVVMAAIV